MKWYASRGFIQGFLSEVVGVLLVLMMWFSNEPVAAISFASFFLMLNGIHVWVLTNNFVEMQKLAEEANAGWKLAIDSWKAERERANVAFRLLQRKYNIPSTN